MAYTTSILRRVPIGLCYRMLAAWSSSTQITDLHTRRTYRCRYPDALRCVTPRGLRISFVAARVVVSDTTVPDVWSFSTATAGWIGGARWAAF